MHHVRSRLALPLLLVTAGLAVGGCGSSDGGGDESAYVETYETACKKVADQTKAFEAETAKIAATAADDPKAAAADLKQGATTLFTTMGEQLQVMADADAPEKFADFQKSISDNAEQVRKTVAQAKDTVANVETLDDFATLGDTLGQLKVAGGEKLPAELAKQAPSCKTLGS